MLIPLTEAEIAEFLGIPEDRVRILWRNGLLKRSVACALRPSNAILHSTPYDAIEYGLASGDLPKRLSREHAALWTHLLAEAADVDNYLHYNIATQANILMHGALVDGLAQLRCDSHEIALIVARSFYFILEEIEKTDTSLNFHRTS